MENKLPNTQEQMDPEQIGIGLYEAHNLLTARCDRRVAGRALNAIHAVEFTLKNLRARVQTLTAENADLTNTVVGMSRRLNEAAEKPRGIDNARKPKNISCTIRIRMQTGDCPCCGKRVDSFFNPMVCGRCGQYLKWPDIGDLI